MCPLLILANVPASKTGVFPERFLSWRGPKRGRSNPKRAVSPSISHDTTSSNLSTRRMGSHFSNHMDSPKVDFPSISCGSTCTCRCSVIQIKIKSYTHYGLWPWPTPSLVMGNLQKGSKYKNNKKERCMIMTMCVCVHIWSYVSDQCCLRMPGNPKKVWRSSRTFFSPHFVFILIFCKKDPLELEVTRQLLYLRNCV